MHRKIVKYKIVWSYDSSGIEERINEEINGGWELYGVTFVSEIPTSYRGRYGTKQLKLCQAMVKYEQEQDIMQSFIIQCAKDSVTLTNKEIDKRFNKFKNDFSKEIKDKYLDLDSNSI